MIALHEKYIIDDKGQRTAAIIPMKAWEQIVEALEELDDIRAYDGAKKYPSDAVPLEQAVSESTCLPGERQA